MKGKRNEIPCPHTTKMETREGKERRRKGLMNKKGRKREEKKQWLTSWKGRMDKKKKKKMTRKVSKEVGNHGNACLPYSVSLIKLSRQNLVNGLRSKRGRNDNGRVNGYGDTSATPFPTRRRPRHTQPLPHTSLSPPFRLSLSLSLGHISRLC